MLVSESSALTPPSESQGGCHGSSHASLYTAVGWEEGCTLSEPYDQDIRYMLPHVSFWGSPRSHGHPQVARVFGKSEKGITMISLDFKGLIHAQDRSYTQSWCSVRNERCNGETYRRQPSATCGWGKRGAFEIRHEEQAGSHMIEKKLGHRPREGGRKSVCRGTKLWKTGSGNIKEFFQPGDRAEILSGNQFSRDLTARWGDRCHSVGHRKSVEVFRQRPIFQTPFYPSNLEDVRLMFLFTWHLHTTSDS